MIKTLSPYYINIPFVSPLTSLVCTSYTLKIYIWKGLKTDVPLNSSYEITKDNPELLQTMDKINIARLVNPFIEFDVPTGFIGLIDSPNQVWVKTSVFYITENKAEEMVPQIQNLSLAVKGYSNGMSGENEETPANLNLITNREFKVDTNSIFVFPIEVTETTYPTPSFTITNVVNTAGNLYDVEFTSVGTYAEITLIVTPDVVDPQVYIIGATSPQNVGVSFTGDVDFQLNAYDTQSGTTAFSNIFTITI